MAPTSTKFFTDRIGIFETTDGVCQFPYEHCDLRQLIEAPYKGRKQTKAARKTFKRRNHVFSRDQQAILRICRERTAQFKEWETARRINEGPVLHPGVQANHLGGAGIEHNEVPGPSKILHQAIPTSSIKIKFSLNIKETTVPAAGSNRGSKEEECAVEEIQIGDRMNTRFSPNRVTKKTKMTFEVKNATADATEIRSWNKEQEVKVEEPQIEERMKTRSNTKGATYYPANKAVKMKAKRVTQRYIRIRDPLKAAKEERRAPKLKGASASQIEDDFKLIELRRAQFEEEEKRGPNQRLIYAVNRLRRHGVRHSSTVLPPRRFVAEPAPKQKPEPANKQKGKIILDLRVLKEKTVAYHDCMARFQRLHSRRRKSTDDYFVALEKEKEKPCLSAEQIEQIREKHRYHPYLNHVVTFMHPEQRKLPERIFRAVQKDVQKALTAAKKEVQLKRDMVKMISLIEGCEDAMDVDSDNGGFILSAVPVTLRSESKKAKESRSGIPLVLTRIEHGEEENSKWTVRKRSSLREEVVLDEVASMRKQLDMRKEEETTGKPIVAELVAYDTQPQDTKDELS